MTDGFVPDCFDHAVAGQVLIKFRHPDEWRDQQKLTAFAKEMTHAAVFAEPIGDGDVALVRSLSGQTTKELQGVFESKTEVVDYVEPDYYIPLDCRDPGVGSNPRLGEQWGLDRINACAVWQKQLQPGAMVAVIDSGIKCTSDLAKVTCHEDFVNKDKTSQIWLPDPGFSVQLGVNPPVTCPGGCFGFDATVDDSQPNDKKWYPGDRKGHGTQIAGMIAASNNEKGIVGISFKSQVLAVKFADDDYGLCSSLKRAIDFVIAVSKQKNLRVVNCSFGFDPKMLLCDSRIVREAFAKLDAESRMLIVASSGNTNLPVDPSKPHYPSDYTLNNLIVATSTDRDDKHFSPSRYDRDSPKFIGAPGVGLLTTQLSDYGPQEGTSFAAAFVSGGAALVLSDAEDGCDKLTTSKLRTLLLEEADSIPNLTAFIKNGRRLNVDRSTRKCR